MIEFNYNLLSMEEYFGVDLTVLTQHKLSSSTGREIQHALKFQLMSHLSNIKGLTKTPVESNTTTNAKRLEKQKDGQLRAYVKKIVTQNTTPQNKIHLEAHKVKTLESVIQDIERDIAKTCLLETGLDLWLYLRKNLKQTLVFLSKRNKINLNIIWDRYRLKNKQEEATARRRVNEMQKRVELAYRAKIQNQLIFLDDLLAELQGS